MRHKCGNMSCPLFFCCFRLAIQSLREGPLRYGGYTRPYHEEKVAMSASVKMIGAVRKLVIVESTRALMTELLSLVCLLCLFVPFHDGTCSLSKYKPVFSPPTPYGTRTWDSLEKFPDTISKECLYRIGCRELQRDIER